MKATPFSNDHYYPMCLGNGRDGVLINYDGSNFVSLNCHTHNVPHEGSPCGWYKMANLTKEDTQYPVIMAGIQVVQFNAPAEPTNYEQEFIPKNAQLVTTLSFRYGLKLRITSFLTKDSIWCERAEVLELPEDSEYDFAFRVNEPFFASGCYYHDFEYPRDVEFNGEDNIISFNYKIGNHSGKGALIANKPFVRFDKRDEREWNNPRNIEGYFEPLKKGDIFERAMICLGDNENHITYNELLEKAKKGVSVLESEHIAEWNAYYGDTSVTLPDEKLNYIYNVSRYIPRAYQHPETGLIGLGMLPNHWKGGVWCSWDAEFGHMAMLTSGSFKESAHYTDAYVKLAPEGYEVLKKNGYSGTAFAGWNTVCGEFIGHTSLEEWLINFKPSFCAYSIFAMYHEWEYNPLAITEQHIKIAEDVIEFWLQKMLVERKGLYYLIDVKDSDETENDVSLDSNIQSTMAKAIYYVYEMTGKEKYKDISDKMLLALEDNRREDGVIANSTGSAYSGFLIWCYRFLSKDGFITPEQLKSMYNEWKTPWGYDTDVATEEYRHWPWYNAVSAESFMLCRKPEWAMESIKNLGFGCSSLGALPEKIRMDGYFINHWYISPHSLVVSTLNYAFARSVKFDEIMLLYGFTRGYGDVECKDIAVKGGYSVSLKVQKGKIKYLSIKNRNTVEKTVILDCNAQFKLPKKFAKVKIAAGSEFVYKK